MAFIDTTVIVISVGSFMASFVNAAFATGGIFILLAASSSVLPLTAAVPLQTPFSLASLLSRIAFFWHYIYWPIVIAFVLGCSIGTFAGARIFIDLPEAVIALSVGTMLLLLIWIPTPSWRLPVKHPFFPIGIVHSFLGTLFGVGMLLQPAILRTDLRKLQITGTLAACLLLMESFKAIGYITFGFDYWRYIPHIIGATVAGLVGSWFGKRVSHKISEQLFRTVFKALITIVAVRLLYRGFKLLAY